MKELGLSDYEEKCYKASLKFNSLSAPEIAKEAHIPVTSVHRNLYSLVDKGFISLLQKNPMLFKAIKPEIAVANAIKIKQNKLSEIEKSIINSLKDIKKNKQEEEKEIIDIVRGRDQTFKLNNMLFQQAKKEVLVVGGGRKQDILDTIHNVRNAASRRVDCKLISGRYPDVDINLLKNISEAGMQVKAQSTSIRYVVCDRKELLLILREPKERICLHIKSEIMASVFSQHFDLLWKKAKPI